MAAGAGARGAISGRELTAAARAQGPRAPPQPAAAAALNLEVSCKSPQIKCLLGGGSPARLECLSLPRVSDSGFALPRHEGGGEVSWSAWGN